MRFFIAALLAFVLIACAAAGNSPGNSPGTTAQITLQGVESAYQAAGQAELIYLKLPNCGAPGATALCATPEKRAQIKAFDNQAYAAIVAARAAADAASPNAAAALATANQSVTTFSAAIPK